MVKASARMADAEAFARFVLSDEGQAILKEFGFQPAEAKGTDSSGNQTGAAPRRADKRQ